MNAIEAKKKRVILRCAVCGKEMGSIYICNACIPNIKIEQE